MADDVPPPDHRRGLPAWRRRLPWAVWTVILIAFSLGWFGWDSLRADTYDQTVIAQSLAMAIIFLSFVVVTGMGGMVSLVQAGFVTAGGFAVGWALTHDFGVDIPGVFAHGSLNFFWAVVLGALAAAAGSVCLFGLYGQYLGGVASAYGHVGVGVLALPRRVVDRVHSQRRGRVDDPRSDAGRSGAQLAQRLAGPPDELESRGLRAAQVGLQSAVRADPAVALVVFGFLTLVVHALMRSPSGRAALAVRSSEVAAEASGVRVGWIKVLIFAVSGAIAGVGGAMLGMFWFSFSDRPAPLPVALFWLAIAVLLGIRRPGGALLAGFLFAGGTAVFHWISSWSFLRGGDVQALITSVFFVPLLSGLGAIQVAQEPDGILAFPSAYESIRQWLGHRNVKKELEAARLP